MHRPCTTAGVQRCSPVCAAARTAPLCTPHTHTPQPHPQEIRNGRLSQTLGCSVRCFCGGDCGGHSHCQGACGCAAHLPRLSAGVCIRAGIRVYTCVYVGGYIRACCIRVYTWAGISSGSISAPCGCGSPPCLPASFSTSPLCGAGRCVCGGDTAMPGGVGTGMYTVLLPHCALCTAYPLSFHPAVTRISSPSRCSLCVSP